MSTTYTTLSSDLAAYTENDSSEFSAQTPTFITNAELRIKREVDSDFFRKYATASTTTGDPFLATPSDMIVDRWMVITDGSGNYQHVRAKDASYLLMAYPDATVTALPKFYSNWDQGILRLGPAPDAIYTVTLAYTYRPTPLSESNESNYISTDMSDALLYAALVEAYGFQKNTAPDDNADLQFWDARYTQAMVAIKNEEEKRKRQEEARYGVIR